MYHHKHTTFTEQIFFFFKFTALYTPFETKFPMHIIDLQIIENPRWWPEAEFGQIIKLKKKNCKGCSCWFRSIFYNGTWNCMKTHDQITILYIAKSENMRNSHICPRSTFHSLSVSLISVFSNLHSLKLSMDQLDKKSVIRLWTPGKCLSLMWNSNIAAK